MIVSERFFLGEEDIMLNKNYTTTATQISNTASWLAISCKDFLEKFLSAESNTDIFMNEARKKHETYRSKIEKKE